MSSSRLVRGSKTRLFATVCLVCVLGAVLFVFHGSQVKLSETQKQASSCTHENEMLNAKLLVFIESKARLEKSLAQSKEENEQIIKEISELRSKLSDLQRSNGDQETELESCRKNISSLTKENAQLMDSKKKLEEDLVGKMNELDLLKKDETVENLKSDLFRKEQEIRNLTLEMSSIKGSFPPLNENLQHFTKVNYQLQEELKSVKQELAECKDREAPMKPVLAQPNINIPQPNEYGSLLKNSSSTPIINPDAVGESSSTKASPKDLGAYDIMKKENQVALPPRKPTPENVEPLDLPRKDDEIGQQGRAQMQIPEPINPPRHIPSADDRGDLVNPMNLPDDFDNRMDSEKHQLFPPADMNKGEEEEEPGLPPNHKHGRSPDQYHGGDYDKEQAEEEDDEGEQIDYDVAGKRRVLPKHGVMINPK